MTARAASIALGCGALALSTAALAALPPFFGGEIRLPAPSPIASLDPAAAETPFEAAVSGAICDGLYRVDEAGAIRPVLAEGMPVVEGAVAKIRIREGVRRHVGSLLTPLAVQSTLRRAARHPRAAWLLAAFADDGGEPDVRLSGEDAIEIRLAGEGISAEQVARILAAAPLELATGRDPARRPLGTGPYSARLASGGEVRLTAFRFAAEGAPYLETIHILPPRSREESLRAFELGRVDGSWHGESLYGGRPVRPVSSTRGPSSSPVLLVPNHARGPLRDRALWGHVAGSIDRRRLERVGLAASSTLGAGLPAPRVPAGRAPTARVTLRMIVREGDAFEAALAEALAGVLDERGIGLHVESLPASRYASATTSGAWDLRLVSVVPPLPGATPLSGAALAATGQIAEARSLALQLADPAAGARVAPQLDAIVLGQRTPVLSHPDTMVGVRFDALGRLELESMYLVREEPR